MLQKKICMLGSFAVGKTSLVRRFVEAKFDEKYLTTIGVKIDRKALEIAGQPLHLILWDIAGEDDYFQVPTSYLRGSAGYLLVVDGTRKRTLEQAIELHARAEATLGDVPYVVVLNKADLVAEWEIEGTPETLTERACATLRTSARTGASVEDAFAALAQAIVAP